MPLQRYASSREYHFFWNSLKNVVTGVLSGDHLLVPMGANALTGKRQNGCADSKVLGAYGCDELNDNGGRLRPRATDKKLALLNTFFATPTRRVPVNSTA